MIALFLLCFCVCAWGYVPALIETTQRYPQKDSLSVRIAVGDYVWSSAASKSVRRKYVVSHMSLALACLTLAQIARTYELSSDKRLVGIIVGNVFAIVIAISTMRKVYKHGL